jgi:hypothetical protein
MTTVLEGLKQLAEMQDLIAADLGGLEGLAESYPLIQWANDSAALKSRPEKGGFVMTLENAEMSGDYPAGAAADTVYFKANDKNPQGSNEACYYVPTLECAPFGARVAWFLGDDRLPHNFDYDALRNAGANPRSKRQLLALVKGQKGPFLAMLTVKGTVAGDMQNALAEHDRAVKRALGAGGINAKSLRANGWRWFWLALGAGTPTVRGSKKKSGVTPIVYVKTGGYIGELKATWWDVEAVKAFEYAWTATAPEAAVVIARAPSSEDAEFAGDEYPEF